jgi:hyperosmotically inducible periplasmic protein
MTTTTWRTTLQAALAAVALGTFASGTALAADRPDPWITTKVKVALLTADGVNPLDVNVDTVDGRVTLHGQVPTAAEQAKAEQVARGIDGVREVRNLIQVVPASASEAVEAADEDVKKRVQEALDANQALQGVEVVSVNDGVVVLGGEAETLSAHVDALEAARDVSGVRRVESEIASPDELADAELWRDETTPPVGAAAGMRATVEDAWITTAAKVKLVAADAPAFDINVDTRNGIVTLFGTVGSDEARRNAEATVKSLDGVKAVRNELQVVAPDQQEATARQDDEIAAALAKRFEERSSLADADIDVQVENGTVRLSGKVDSQADRISALTLARTTEGVRGVTGELRVESD